MAAAMVAAVKSRIDEWVNNIRERRDSGGTVNINDLIHAGEATTEVANYLALNAERNEQMEPRIQLIEKNTQTWIKEIVDKVSTMERQLKEGREEMAEVKKTIKGGTFSGNGFNKGFMEYKGVQYVQPLVDDKGKFRKWHKKFIGAIAQVNQTYSDMLDDITRKLDTGLRIEEAVNEVTDLEESEMVDKANSDIYAVILEKADGDMAYKKVQSVARGEGLKGYVVLYKWFTEVSGMGLMEQARRLMHPEAPKKEEDIAAAVEEWEEKMKRLGAHGREYELSPMFKIIALGCLTVGRAREYFEMWEAETRKDEDGFNTLKNKIKEYSKKKNLDNRAKKGDDPMDCDAISKDNKHEQEQWDDEGDVNAVSKGKGKGKIGKGGFKGNCYNCGAYGHSARFCGKGKGKGETDKGKGKGNRGYEGNCYNCGGVGHPARECPSRSMGKRQAGR